jgi:hypothetical protein
MNGFNSAWVRCESRGKLIGLAVAAPLDARRVRTGAQGSGGAR